MWKTRLLLAASLAAHLASATPVTAKTDYNEFFSGIAQSLLNQQLDQSAYVAAQGSNTASAYRDYLTRFPKGAYRVNAEQALARLGVTVGNLPPVSGNQSAATLEANLGLSRTQRILIQRQLTAIGYATGVADGLWGTNTRSAVFRWQGANKQTATGYVTGAQVNLIARQAGPGVGTDPVGPVVGNDQTEERLLGLTYAERRDVQIRLSRLGYNTYGADGVFGGNTRRALATWQRDEAVRVSGYLTADQLRELRTQTGG
jgi:peptidoglycan hydrolase-like protein with peptidoglycan-binding domain